MPHLNTTKMKDPESITQFANSLDDVLNTAQQEDCVMGECQGHCEYQNSSVMILPGN